jgi:hypothetical protein
VTFHARDDTWLLFDGVGVDGCLLGRRSNPPMLIDFGISSELELWACCSSGTPAESVIERIRIPDLVAERFTTPQMRLSAIATSTDAQQIAALQVPNASGEFPALWVWSGQTWHRLPCEVNPDVSSRLAWIDNRRIAFESSMRHICVLDLELETVDIGSVGCCPAAAPDVGQWYAVRSKRVVAFDVNRRTNWTHTDVEGIQFGQVTSLRVTRDGEVFSWTEPRLWFGSKTYIQQHGRRRIPHRKLKHGLWVVLGPYEFPTN